METQSKAKRSTAIRLDPAQIDRVMAVAVREDRSFSEMLRRLIEIGLRSFGKKQK